MSDAEELKEAAIRTKQILQEMRRQGITHVPGTGRAEPAGAQTELFPAGSAAPQPAKTLSLSEKQAVLEPVRLQAMDCQLCKLCKGRHSVVFGDGSLVARLVFVGEGRGRDEDAQGVPFVGAAGQLLNKIIAAMKMTRPEVYICNIVKCRPPNNRPPEPDEVAACMPYLEQQLATIQPKVICALGKTAAAALLETQAPMGALRGRTFERNGIPLIVTYHPAYLLRNPAAKKDVWEDIQLLMKEMGLKKAES